MKRFSLLTVVCVVVVSLVCSAALGAFKMDANRFNEFCKNASASEVQNALNAGAEMSYDACGSRKQS